MSISDFIRCTSNEELFFNYNYANPIGIDLDFENDTQEQYRFVMYPQDALQDQSEVENNIHIVQLGTHASNEPGVEAIKYYKFQHLSRYDQIGASKQQNSVLATPTGNNLYYLLLNNKVVQEKVATILSEFDLNINLNHAMKSIGFEKRTESMTHTFPYQNLPDTILRYIFHLIAIETNQGNILVFEEPESHSYPTYVAQLAEKIAKYSNDNQFFIATHSFDFIAMIIDKSPYDEINLFLTYMDNNGETQVKLIDKDQLKEILTLQWDLFTNLDELIETI